MLAPKTVEKEASFFEDHPNHTRAAFIEMGCVPKALEEKLGGRFSVLQGRGQEAIEDARLVLQALALLSPAEQETLTTLRNALHSTEAAMEIKAALDRTVLRLTGP